MRTTGLIAFLVACTQPQPYELGGATATFGESVDMSVRPPPPFDLTLSVDDLAAGMPATLTVSGASPGDTIYLAGSKSGLGTSGPIARLGGRSLDILGPHSVFGPFVADGYGTVVVDLTDRIGPVGTAYQFQAAMPAGASSALSDAVERIVAPNPRDVDGDGLLAYPWGTDLDDDDDGALTYRVGGTDLDDRDGVPTLNGGTATWGVPAFTALDMYASPTGVALGDFDNDGLLDVVTSNQDTSATTVLPGRGDGTFDAPVTTAAGGGGDAVVGDFDEDGNLDYIAGLNPVLHLGDGALGFAGALIDPAVYSVIDMHVLDLDGDGHLDLGGYDYGNGATVLLGNGDGTFQPPVEIVSSGCYAASFADFTGDGIVDIAMGFGSDMKVEIWAGDGAGGFSLDGTLVTTNDVWHLQRGDFDGDGFDDLITSSEFEGVLEVWSNDGSGAFTRTDEVTPTTDINRFASADLDGDGDHDVLGTSQLGTWLLESQGDGTFAAPVATGYDESAFDLVVGDLDDDGILDQVVIDLQGDRLGVSMGQ